MSFDDSDKRWVAYLRAHVGNLELLPAIVTHWERTAKPITRPLKVEELCKAFVLYRQSKGLDKATLSEDRYISKRLQKRLGGYMAHELGIAEIRSFLDSAKTSDSLEHKLHKVGSLIFAYGRETRSPKGTPKTKLSSRFGCGAQAETRSSGHQTKQHHGECRGGRECNGENY